MKLVLSPEVLQSMGSPNQILFPGWLIKFIGVCEVLGALGLLLPGLLRVRPQLTTIAALGLVIIMIGATAVSIAGDGILAGLFPLLVALLLILVVYGRSRVAPFKA
jgi:hypothetical protein